MQRRLHISFPVVIVAVLVALMIVDASFLGMRSTIRLLMYLGAAALMVLVYESMPERRDVRRRARRRRRGQCERCGYDLRGRETSPDRSRCPECGSQTTARPSTVSR